LLLCPGLNKYVPTTTCLFRACACRWQAGTDVACVCLCLRPQAAGWLAWAAAGLLATVSRGRCRCCYAPP
jgi:hypothetical protein